ncbi:hypothetical protein, partial [Lysinibacillus xylanilyticus]|uniref:hypothetical protein n=1 Tax=Lysinibacillus xylanilyticus TaxID=582475 RepID=UPI0036DA178D
PREVRDSLTLSLAIEVSSTGEITVKYIIQMAKSMTSICRAKYLSLPALPLCNSMGLPVLQSMAKGL